MKLHVNLELYQCVNLELYQFVNSSNRRISW